MGDNLGVDLSPLVISEERTLQDFAGKALAIDAYNILYQFLSVIRTQDGTPLMDHLGRPVSHLSGLLQRTTSLLSEGIRPVYVFDGVPHPLKMETILERKALKERAEREYREALEAGDLEMARTKAMQTSRITDEILQDARALLDALGVPYLIAPSEGEAQASHMARKGDVWSAVSQDYDSLLFGSPRLVRNLGITGRRKLPGQRKYVTIRPEEIDLDKVLTRLGISREQLVDVAILVGTDFNQGVKGIGPKKALNLIRRYGDLEGVISARGVDVPHYEEVRRIFLEPEVTDDYELEWHPADEDEVIRILCDEHDFSEERVRAALKKAESFRERASQRSLEDFF